jgi:hypothetical protein
MEELTQKQIDVIKHTVGLDRVSKQPKGFYRNRFFANEDHQDYSTLSSLVELDIMVHLKADEMFGGNMMFYLTPKGLKLAKTYSI